MKVINFFGAPNSGKSTTAAELFVALKKKHLVVEIIPEFAKVLSWSSHKVALRDQLYIFAKQHHRVAVLKDKCDVVILDSPLPTSLQFIPEDYFPSFKELVLEVFNSFDNINYYLPGIQKYSAAGRHHTLEQCEDLADVVEEILKSNRIPYTEIVPTDKDAMSTIVNQILGKL